MSRKRKAKDLMLDMATVFELRMCEAEAKAGMASAAMYTAARAELLKQLDPEGKIARLDGLIVGNRQTADIANNRRADVVKRIEEQLGINMSEYSWDDESGRLFLTPKETTDGNS